MTEVSSRYAKGLKFAAKPDVMSQVEFEVFARRCRGSSVKMPRPACLLSGPLMLARVRISWTSSTLRMPGSGIRTRYGRK